MSQEIERKFLVVTLPDLSDAKPTYVRQGYLTLPEDSVEIRVRQKGERYFMTLKGGEGLVRTEREAEVSVEQFDTFWPETEGRRVEKTRHTGTLPDGMEFELDVFSGALDGLCMVEVEFNSEDAANAFAAPGWFGDDVTSDKRYKNKALALNGLPG